MWCSHGRSFAGKFLPSRSLASSSWEMPVSYDAKELHNFGHEGAIFQESFRTGVLKQGAFQKRPIKAGKRRAGVAGLEPVTSAVTGQRSNQLSYTPRMGSDQNSETFPVRQCSTCKKRRFGQQTPRRWGWGTPLKKRTATRIKILTNSNELSGVVNVLMAPRG